MTSMDDDPQDELTRAYRAASERDAGRPSAAVRAAILANARHEAGKRTPAANEGRFWWRAVAGVAMLGVAVLVWRQVDPDLVRDATVSSERSAATVAQSARDTAVADSVPSPAPEAPREVRRAPEARAGNQAQAYVPERPPMPAVAPTQDRVESLAKASPPPAAPAAAQAASQAQERELLTARSRAATSAIAGAIPQNILQREFPEDFASTAPASRLWLVTDAEGRTVAKGRIEPGEDLAGLAARLQREAGMQVRSAWSTVTSNNARGVAIELNSATVTR